MKCPSASAGRQSSPCVVDVRFIRTYGCFSSPASASALITAPTSCPSMSRAVQPNASHFAAMGSIVVIVVHRAVHLGVVRVEQHGQAVQPVVTGEHRRLPDLALLELAVADHRERAPVLAGEAVRQGEARGGRQALPERAAGVVHDRRALGADRLDRRAVLAVAGLLVLREDAELGGGREDADDVVAGRADQPVTAWLHDREQRGDLLGGRQRLPEVAEPVRCDHADGAQPDERGQAGRVGYLPARSRVGDPHRRARGPVRLGGIATLCQETVIRQAGPQARGERRPPRPAPCPGARGPRRPPARRTHGRAPAP
jgi:hypothetical protein